MKRSVMRVTLALLGIMMCVGFFELKAQSLVVGAEYGISQMSLHKSLDGTKSDDFLTNRVGVSLEFSPYFSKFYISSGANIAMSDLGKNLMIPLTFRLALGNKIRPFGEIGGYYGINLADTEDQYLPQGDLGVKSMFGVMLNLDKRWWIELAYSMNFGLKDGYHEEILLPLEQVSINPYRTREKGVNLRVKYRF